MTDGLAIVAALEAIEVGDIDSAVEILLAAGEDAEPVGAGAYPCPRCPAVFRWPGELDHHRRFAHLEEAA